jgi:hypothetical protein
VAKVVTSSYIQVENVAGCGGLGFRFGEGEQGFLVRLFGFYFAEHWGVKEERRDELTVENIVILSSPRRRLP